jgi:hypothetical protein
MHSLRALDRQRDDGRQDYAGMDDVAALLPVSSSICRATAY